MDKRKFRKDCRYNKEELLSILPFQADFISSSTHERLVLMKRKICPAMFNHWLELGKEYNVNESKLLSKVLSTFWILVLDWLIKFKMIAGTYEVVFKQLAYGPWSRKRYEVSDQTNRCALEDQTRSGRKRNLTIKRGRREDGAWLRTKDDSFKKSYRKYDTGRTHGIE